jgi:guanylate kinase
MIKIDVIIKSDIMFQNILSQLNTNCMTEIRKKAQSGIEYMGRQGVRLIVFCGPSNCGKTTLAKMLVNSNHQDYALSISHTTRNLRPGERDGVDYFKVSTEEFLSMTANGQFIEFQEVYKGTYYGTSRNAIAQIAGVDKIAVLDVDVKGAQKIKKSYGDSAFIFFVTPNIDDAIAIEILKERALKRDKVIDPERIERTTFELSTKNSFDCLLINLDGKKDKAFNKTTRVLDASFLNKVM